MVNSNDDGTVSKNRNDHIDNAKNDFQGGNKVKGRRPWSTSDAGKVVFAKIELEDVRYSGGVVAIRVR